MVVDDQEEKKYFSRALYFPVVLLLLMWIIKLAEVFGGISFSSLGIYPRAISGFKGVVFAPLVHADFKHLINNSVPFFLLTLAIFYFYKPVALRVIFFIWLVTGLCVWIAGREAYHIGASSLIYGNASFLFFSGVIRKNINLLAISLLIIFLYGGMVWGILPLDITISWESHLFGGITGLVFSFIYSKDGPKMKENSLEDEEDDDDGYPFWKVNDDEVFDEDKSSSADEKK